ncbi:hypothetical protein [Cytobacillus sp. AMY 15.2]|nr:hypothetical protein [Cytobacillus sp. AMY 15.2]
MGKNRNQSIHHISGLKRELKTNQLTLIAMGVQSGASFFLAADLP